MPEIDHIADSNAQINVEIVLPHNAQIEAAMVLGSVLDNNKNPIESYDPKPILDAQIYKVMFPDESLINNTLQI